ncbi:MAG: hypothetical protein HRU20_15805 [Pseudomonadales bacterium]|nr:hypothetical protein [Pseudomonadales bacterium]
MMSKMDMTADTIQRFINELIPDSELSPASIDEVVKLPAFLEKMQQCEVFFEKPYSELDQDIQDAVVLRRLQQMINTLLLNPLWKDRIEQSGIKKYPLDFVEWQRLPISDKSTQNELYMGERSGLVVPLSYGGFEIVASGGTSEGLPVETVYSLRELHDTYKVAGEFMGRYQLPAYLQGCGPKWMITTLADYQMWSSGTMVGGVLQQIPNVNFIGAGPVNKEVYQHIMSYKGSKAIMGISQSISLLVDLGEGMEEEAKNSFHLALFGSGLVPQRKQAELKALYPNIQIMSYFAATQAEMIGLQLSHESPYLSSVPGLHFIEIVDEEGYWVDEGEEGELVITRLHAHEAPLIRFKVGDRMIRRPNINTQALKTLQFEFSGRSGDIIHLCDTQYGASQVYCYLCSELNTAAVFDLATLAHDIQFVNYRKDKELVLLAEVDDVEYMNEQMQKVLGDDGLRPLFIKALIRSLSLFNKGEANMEYMDESDYSFEIKPIIRNSTEVHRTAVGKVPLIRDQF